MNEWVLVGFCLFFCSNLAKIIWAMDIFFKNLKEGIYARRVFYMDIRGQGAIPLTITNENIMKNVISRATC
ncbi:hypothetical protein DCAR_0103929 [Daucus carota subsp. sativus]|uniref:Uncharacterized protein n=1 Tax=Daucus carota subsp. sativus TaxID=79200 RepID=A0AAF0WB24_DAUCS|nr:hypothetical protein DCAR_0103929 [Daucus carota subsp. sativus]